MPPSVDAATGRLRLDFPKLEAAIGALTALAGAGAFLFRQYNNELMLGESGLSKLERELADGALVRQADFYPALDCAREVFLPQVRFVIGAQTFAESQRVTGVPCKSQQPHHHALVGFGRMARQHQRMGRVMAAIRVADVQFGLEDGCVECHELVTVSWGRKRSNEKN